LVITLITPKKAFGPIEGRARAANELDPIDELDVERELGADVRLVVDGIVHAMPVDQDQDSRVVVAGTLEAADADVAVVAIVRHVEARGGPDNLGEGPIAVERDIARGHDRYGRGRVGDLLQELRRAKDGLHLNLHEVGQLEVGQRTVLRAQPGAKARSRARRSQPRGASLDGFFNAARARANSP
jgi:hypothetical protein